MPSTIREHDCIVLTEDVTSDSLRAGDVGTVVHIHRGGDAYEVEFMSLTGDTLAVETLSAGQVRPVARNDIVHVREMRAA